MLCPQQSKLTHEADILRKSQGETRIYMFHSSLLAMSNEMKSVTSCLHSNSVSLLGT